MEIAELNRWLAERNLGGHWLQEHGPEKWKPYLWKWSEVYEALCRAGEAVPIDKSGRRTIQLKNPSLERGMTHTIHISVQLVKPGEIARSHRHVAAAIRYVLKGSDKAFTVVEGERFPMQEGDLITTPNWTWHDHYNGSGEPIIWLDGLDVRLASYLGAQFQEDFRQEQQPIEKPDSYSAKVLGHARPSWIKPSRRVPPFRYRWEETYSTLLALKQSEGDPFDGVRLEYTNPYHGGPTLTTFSCEIQLLRGGEKTKAHRHTSTTVYHAFRGKGATEIGGQTFQWDQGDLFVVPPWHSHRHENLSKDDSIHFSITDRPALEVLALYREEPLE